MTSAQKILKLDKPFEMRRGGALHDVQIAYETWGDIGFCYDNAVLIFTGLSPSAHAASSTEDPSPGWWEDMIGPGRPIDTDKYFVICVNSLGSPFGSTSPASINPATGKPYRLTFPVLTIEDIARAGHEVALSLGVRKAAAVIGPSLGGMTALAYCALFPGATRSVVSISGAARSQPFSIALRSLQREIIRRDPLWQDGNYAEGSMPVTGMRLARKLGMITYRSAKEWALRFGRERADEERKPGDPFGIDFEVESYMDHHAIKFTGQYDPNCYLYISRAMDLFDLADHGGSVQAALHRFDVERALIMGVETDLLFPIEQQQELADGLQGNNRQVTFARLPSLQGHDSFLVDMDRFRPIIADFMNALNE